jgi:hypothetical protein
MSFLRAGKGGGGAPIVKAHAPTSGVSNSGATVTITNVVGTVVGVMVRYTSSSYIPIVISDNEKGYYAATGTETYTESTSYKFTQTGTTVTLSVATSSPANIHVVYFSYE